MRAAFVALATSLALSGCAERPSQACPAQFEAFLHRFSTDTAFQMTAVADPLVETELADDLEAPPVRSLTPKAKLSPPLIESPDMLKKEKLERRIEEAKGARRQVIVHPPDSDAYVMRYTFERRGCWTLVQRDDESL